MAQSIRARNVSEVACSVPQTFMILYRGVYVVSHLKESADRSCALFSVLAPCSRGLAEVTMLRIVRQDPIIGWRQQTRAVVRSQRYWICRRMRPLSLYAGLRFMPMACPAHYPLSNFLKGNSCRSNSTVLHVLQLCTFGKPTWMMGSSMHEEPVARPFSYPEDSLSFFDFGLLFGSGFLRLVGLSSIGNGWPL